MSGFPSRLRPYIEERWRELGYDGVSAYVTGVIRYDLAVGGPHTHYTGADTDPAQLEELDRLTEETFRANRGRRGTGGGDEAADATAEAGGDDRESEWRWQAGELRRGQQLLTDR